MRSRRAARKAKQAAKKAEEKAAAKPKPRGPPRPSASRAVRRQGRRWRGYMDDMTCLQRRRRDRGHRQGGEGDRPGPRRRRRSQGSPEGAEAARKEAIAKELAMQEDDDAFTIGAPTSATRLRARGQLQGHQD